MKFGWVKFIFPFLFFIPKRMWPCLWVPFIVLPLTMWLLFPQWDIYEYCGYRSPFRIFMDIDYTELYACRRENVQDGSYYMLITMFTAVFIAIPLNMVLIYPFLQRVKIRTPRNLAKMVVYAALLVQPILVVLSYGGMRPFGLSIYIWGGLIAGLQVAVLWLFFPVPLDTKVSWRRWRSYVPVFMLRALDPIAALLDFLVGPILRRIWARVVKARDKYNKEHGLPTTERSDGWTEQSIEKRFYKGDDTVIVRKTQRSYKGKMSMDEFVDWQKGHEERRKGLWQELEDDIAASGIIDYDDIDPDWKDARDQKDQKDKKDKKGKD